MSGNNNNEENEVQLDASNKAEKKTLKQVLGINMFQVALAGIVGLYPPDQVHISRANLIH
ncbi:hypothetical protein [Algoriphagus sp.]|uniref:hypothetical protein n=1 Tax=Algoriphagus sp. TaxID=1872435 RepID=UPI003F72C808